MAALSYPKNTYNPRGDAAKLLSYRPNGAVITDDDGAFLAVRPIILNLNSFDADDNFVADDHTIAYLRKIESETMAILLESASIEDAQKSNDFANDAIIARVAPLIDRIRFAAFAGTNYRVDGATFFMKNIANNGTMRTHMIIIPRLGDQDFPADGIDLATMSKWTTPVT